MQFEKLIIVIPTRNRVDLALNAIDSVLSQKNCEIELVVSDNSTESDQINTLKNFCDSSNDSRLSYIRPPEPLPMTKHWNWIIKQVLENYDFSHITYLTDRMIFKPGALSDLCDISQKHPERITAYGYDSIDDNELPVAVRQTKVTERLLEISSSYNIERFLDLNLIPPLPTMLNSVIHKNLLVKMKESYGQIFEGISPDFNFCFKCLDMVSSTLFYDKNLLVAYGLARSNGNNFNVKNPPKDVTDFKKNISADDIFIETPLSSVTLISDILLNEYFAVKNKAKSDRFIEIEEKKYLERLFRDAIYCQNPAFKQESLETLTKKIGRSKAFYNHLKVKNPFKRAKNLINRVLIEKALAEREITVSTKFASLEKAMEYILNNPLEPSQSLEILRKKFGISIKNNDSIKIHKY